MLLAAVVLSAALPVILQLEQAATVKTTDLDLHRVPQCDLRLRLIGLFFGFSRPHPNHLSSGEHWLLERWSTELLEQGLFGEEHRLFGWPKLWWREEKQRKLWRREKL